MSDKTATDRLRELLDERGVEYETKDRPEAIYADWEAWMHGDRHQPNGAIRRETLWGQPVDQHGATLKGVYHAKATEMGDRLLLEAQLVTPEQAIAATVGAEDTYTREECEASFVRGYSLGCLPVGSDPRWDENRQTVDEHMAELGWVRINAATLGRGNLTAEQVREAIMYADRWKKPMGDTGMTNTHLIIRDDGWQAIADELNATLGRGTCELDASIYWDVNPDEPYWEHELSCGHTVRWDDAKPPKFCPECGKEVRGTNEDGFQDVIY